MTILEVIDECIDRVNEMSRMRRAIITTVPVDKISEVIGLKGPKMINEIRKDRR